jgi:hypothetical protein
VIVACVAPFVLDLPEMYDHVARYHLDRGVHAESLYGSAAMVARSVFDADIEVIGAFGAFDLDAKAGGPWKTVSNLAALGVLLDLMLTAATRVRRGDGAHLCVAVAGSLVLLTAVGRVFSPQYLVWLAGAMACGLCVAPRLLRWAAICLGASIALSGYFYPKLFFPYFALEGDALAVALARNVLLVAAGILGVRAAWRYRSDLPAVEEHEGVEPVLGHVPVGPDR